MKRIWVFVLILLVGFIVVIAWQMQAGQTVSVTVELPPESEPARVDWGVAAIFYLAILSVLGLVVLLLVRAIRWVVRRMGAKGQAKADIF